MSQSSKIMQNKQPVPKCNICKKNVTAIKFPGLCCCSCKAYFHSNCVGLSNDVLNTMIKSKLSWSCPGCKTKSSGRRSIVIPPTNIDAPSTSSAKENVTHHNNVSQPTDLSRIVLEMAEMKSSLTTFMDTVQFFNEKFDDFKIKMDNVTTLVDRVVELEMQNSSLGQTVDSLTDKVNYLEQSACHKHLLLCGIPELESENESTTDLVVQFINNVEGCYMSKRDIKSAIRIIPRPSSASSSRLKKPKKILIEFYSPEVRDSVKSAVRLKKKSSRTLLFKNKEVDFYAADYLTHFYNQLLYSAKDFAKTNKFYAVWVCNCNIMLKKTKDSTPFIIKTLTDLQKLNLTV